MKNNSNRYGVDPYPIPKFLDHYGKKKTLSPYMNKTIKRIKIQGVKCKLSCYLPRHKEGLADPNIVFYYEVSASDGSYKKLLNEQDAIKAFAQLVEFEKRQMVMTL